jgi:hypothetical protein
MKIDAPTILAVWRETRAGALRPRERRLFETIWDFAMDREGLFSASRDDLACVAGMSEGNLCDSLKMLLHGRTDSKGLVHSAMLRQPATDTYEVVLPASSWNLRPKVKPTSKIEALMTRLRAKPAQLDFSDPIEGTAPAQARPAFDNPFVIDSAASAGRYGEPCGAIGATTPVASKGVSDSGAECTSAHKKETPFCFPSAQVSPAPRSAALLWTYHEIDDVQTEKELFECLLQLIGDRALRDYGGWYRLRWRQHRGKFIRVFKLVGLDVREGRVNRNVGGHFYDVWQRSSE